MEQAEKIHCIDEYAILFKKYNYEIYCIIKILLIAKNYF